MKVQQLWNDACEKIGDDEAQYDVVTAINWGDEDNEERIPIEDIEWDHVHRQLILVQE